MPQRQFPKPAEIFELMRFKKPELDATKRRLDARADHRRPARRSPSAARRRPRSTTPTAPPRARSRWPAPGRRSRTSSSTRRSCATSRTSTPRRPSSAARRALPFGIAPTGFTRLMQTEGEIAGAGAAGAAGIPFTLSTLGTTSIEDVKAANPNGRNWFQLYVMRDREISYGLVEPRRRGRLRHPVLHRRHPRRRRPAARQAQRLLDPAAADARHHPQRDPAAVVVVRLPHHPQAGVRLARPSTGGTVGELLDAAMDPTDQLRRPRRASASMWPGKLVVKGVQNVEDAQALADLGRRRHRAVQPRRPPARPRARSRSTCCPRWSREVGGGRRGRDSTPAS